VALLSLAESPLCHRFSVSWFITELLPRRIGLDDSLILNLFLPILLFEAAINTDISRLRSTVKPIALLAGPGLLFPLCDGSAEMGTGLTWIPALLAGVILAITYRFSHCCVQGGACPFKALHC